MNLVFDIGGTKLRVAMAEGHILGEIKKVPTPLDLSETIRTLTEIAQSFNVPLERAAGCIPAQIHKERGVYDANNRPLWEGRHMDRELAEVLQMPVRIENDCAVIGLGEREEGAGKGSSRMAYVTVSTGVGAALIVDGDIVAPDGFFFGHTRVHNTELELLVSGTAIKKKFGIEPKDLDSLEERNALAEILAEGLVTLVETWSPDTIVLGGSMIVGINPIPLERVASELAERLVMHPNLPAVKMAQLGDNGGLVGSAILAEKLVSQQ